jgi:acylphosphatase
MTRDASADLPGDPAPLRARVDVLVAGRVQGVGYRFHAQAIAQALGLTGWVANLADGRVRCIAEGPRPQLERWLQELKRGPAGARVDGVDVTWGVATDQFERFAIRSGAHPGD